MQLSSGGVYIVPENNDRARMVHIASINISGELREDGRTRKEYTLDVPHQKALYRCNNSPRLRLPHAPLTLCPDNWDLP